MPQLADGWLSFLCIGSSYPVEDVCCCRFLHFDIRKEFLASVLQTGTEEIDDVIDDQETVMVMTAGIDSDWRVLLVMPLHGKLLLLLKIIVFYLIVFTV